MHSAPKPGIYISGLGVLFHLACAAFLALSRFALLFFGEDTLPPLTPRQDKQGNGR